jgi:putative toxin-antitoxin system antitoxin component (TIGR02293 family)
MKPSQARVQARKERRIVSARSLARELAHKNVVRGVDARVVKSAVDERVLKADEVYRFVPKSTFARKLRSHAPLSLEEGDRLARLARLKAYAEEVFESAEDADTWLHEANPFFGGEKPIDLLLTDEGARRVETALRRIDFGDYS